MQQTADFCYCQRDGSMIGWNHARTAPDTQYSTAASSVSDGGKQRTAAATNSTKSATAHAPAASCIGQHFSHDFRRCCTSSGIAKQEASATRSISATAL